MLNKDTCVSCKFFKLGDINTTGLCIRYPPQILAVPGTLAGQLQIKPFFPLMDVSQWCGEFIVKPEQIN